MIRNTDDNTSKAYYFGPESDITDNHGHASDCAKKTTITSYISYVAKAWSIYNLNGLRYQFSLLVEWWPSIWLPWHTSVMRSLIIGYCTSMWGGVCWNPPLSTASRHLSRFPIFHLSEHILFADKKNPFRITGWWRFGGRVFSDLLLANSHVICTYVMYGSKKKCRALWSCMFFFINKTSSQWFGRQKKQLITTKAR